MANTLKFKRGLLAGIPTAALGEPLFTTDTFDLYIGNGTGNTKFQKFIASGTTSQLLRGDGSLLTMPIVLTSPSSGQVLKYNGTNWVNDSDAGITGSGTTNYLPKFTGATTLGNSLVFDNGTNVGIGTSSPDYSLTILSSTLTTLGIIDNAEATDQKRWAFQYGTPVGAGTFRLRAINDANSSGQNAYIITRSGITVNSHFWYINGTEGARLSSNRNFIINNASTDNGLRFQVTGDGYFSGNLGLGRTPAFRLDVQTSAVSGGVDYVRFQNGAANAAGNASAILLGDASDNKAEIRATTVDLNNGYLGFYTQGSGSRTEKMRLDASGNLGLGVTPSAWVSTYKAIQVNTFASFGGNSDDLLTAIGNNFYNDGGAKYIGTGQAALYTQYQGQHRWNTAPSGTAGNAISFTQPMTLFATGNLAVGTTSDAGFKLDVNGTMRVIGNGEFISSGSENILTVRSTWSNAYLNLSRADSSSLAYLQFRTGATNNWQIGTPVGGTYLWFLEAGVERFRIANGGAATFSSSVTTGSPITIQAAAPFIEWKNVASTRLGYIQHNATNLVYNADTGVHVFNQAATFSSSVTAGGGVISGTYSAATSGRNIEQGIVASSYAQINAYNRSASAYIPFYIDGSFILLNSGSGGNVGIGGTPAERLDVQGSANSIQARFGNVAGRGLTIGTSAISGTNDAGVVFNAPTATDGTLIFQTTSVERARISGSGNLLINTTSDTGYKLRVNGTSYFDDNLRFPNLKGCVFVQTGGTLLGSIAMDSANAVTIDNNGFAGLSVGGSYTMTGGNLGIGHSAFGTSGTKTISVNSGTAPSTSPADAFQLYSADITAGNAAPHFRTENGGIIKLYQQTTAVTSATYIGGAGTTVTDLDTFDGYTIPQIVKALRNAGLLA